METLIAKLIEQVGLDEGIAQKVAEFIKNNMGDIPSWLGEGALDKLPGGLGNLLGGD